MGEALSLIPVTLKKERRKILRGTVESTVVNPKMSMVILFRIKKI